MGTIKCILPTFTTLTDEQAGKINNNSFVVNHRTGEYIFSQDKPISHLMYLNKGLVKIFREEQKNRSTILRISGPGSYVGLFSIFYGKRYQFSALAIEDTELVYVELQLINKILAENGRFALEMIQLFGKDGMEMLNKLIAFPQKQVPGRLAEVLLLFSSDIYGHNEFTLPLSRQELADMIYSTKESVSRTLTEFKNDRIIDIDDRKVTLKSLDLLNLLSKLG